MNFSMAKFESKIKLFLLKNSLFGDSHAHGIEGVHFYTRGKVVTSRWLDPSHGGINLGFPQN